MGWGGAGLKGHYTISYYNMFFLLSGDIPPLPPSLQYSTLPSRGKFASALNMTDLVSAAVKILKPYESHQELLPANIKNTKYQIQYSLSASNSGRTSPVMEENEEGSDNNLQQVAASCDTLCPTNDQSPNSVSKGLTMESPLTKQTPDSQVSKGNKKLPSTTSYDSNSLQRRKQASSGGLRRALSMYQDNKRQTAGARRALFRGTSTDSSVITSKYYNYHGNYIIFICKY